MIKVIKGIVFSSLLLVSSISSATIIINADTTVDTEQGLEFLHVDQVAATLTSAEASAGFMYDGFSWQLATVDQLINLVANAMGTSLPAWNGLSGISSNYNDYDFSAADAQMMLDALGSQDTGPSWIDGESFGISQFWAHEGFWDIHIQPGDWWGTTGRALFVKAAEVSEPATLLLMGAGLLGLGIARKRKVA